MSLDVHFRPCIAAKRRCPPINHVASRLHATISSRVFHAFPSEAFLMPFQDLDLLRTRTLLIEPISHPLMRQPLRQLQPHHPLPHTQHLRVVARDALLHAVAIVRRHRPHTRDFVGADGDPETRPADQQGAIDFAGRDHLGGIDCNVGIGRRVGVFGDADVGHGGDEWVGRKNFREGGLVAVAGGVAADGVP